MKFVNEKEEYSSMHYKEGTLEKIGIRLRKNNYKIQIFIGIIIIICLGMYRIKEQYVPIILMDEFGYWSNAAYFAGYDWSEINQFNSYYSYGYSFLLSIIIRLCANSQNLYRIAIGLNIACVCCMFLGLIKIGIMLCDKASKTYIIVVSLISVLYPSIIANMHVAWCETTLSVTYLIVVLTLILFLQSRKYIFLILFCCGSFFCYIVHQRSLGILCSGVVIVVLLWTLQYIDWKRFILGIACFSILIIGHKIIKNNILDYVFVVATNENANINDYGSIISHVLQLLNPEGIRRLCLSVFGKILYLLIASMGIIGFSFVYIFDNTFTFFKSKKKGTEDKNNNLFVISVYMFLSIVSTLLISAVFTVEGNRLDTLVYGRYTEWMIAPVILMGFLYADANRKRIAKVTLGNVIIILMLCFIVLGEYKIHTEWTGFFDVCSFIMAYFRSKAELKDFSFIVHASYVTVSFLLIYLTGTKRKRPEWLLVTFYLVFILPASYWCLERVFASNYRSDICLKMNQYISSEEKVYFVNDNGQGLWYIADLQVMNPKMEMESIEPEDIETIEGYLLSGTNDKEVNLYEERIGDAIVSNFQISLYYIKGCTYENNG